MTTPNQGQPAQAPSQGQAPSQQGGGMDWGGFLDQGSIPQHGSMNPNQAVGGQFMPRDQRGRFMSPQALRQQQEGGGHGNNVLDFQQALAGQYGALQNLGVQTQQSHAELEALKAKNAEQEKLLGGLRQVFNPQPEGDPIDQEISGYEQQLDYYLQEALEAEKMGQSIPLTTNLAVQLFQGKIAQAKERRNWEGKMQKLENQIRGLTDPNVTSDRQAYGNIDNFIINNVEMIYGSGQDTQQIRNVQFEAVARLVSDEIKRIKSQMPDVWDTIKRSPDKQKRLVGYFFEQNLPPAVRQRLETEKLQNTPMSQDELTQAFREADQIQDERTRNDVKQKIRQELLSMRFGNSAQYGGRSPINQMLR